MNSSIVGISFITNICTLASRILILVIRPSIMLPSFGRSVACVCWVVASCLDIDTVGRPFLAGVVTVGPRIDAWIILEGDEVCCTEEGGRWVPDPGMYDDDRPRGWPGRAICGRVIIIGFKVIFQQK